MTFARCPIHPVAVAINEIRPDQLDCFIAEATGFPPSGAAEPRAEQHRRLRLALMHLFRDDPVLVSRPDPATQHRIAERGDFQRTGDMNCECGYLYSQHQECRGYPTFHILCDGRIIKL